MREDYMRVPAMDKMVRLAFSRDSATNITLRCEWQVCAALLDHARGKKAKLLLKIAYFGEQT